MGSDKKKTEGAQDHGQEIDEPVSMYILFARMFSIIARRIEDVYKRQVIFLASGVIGGLICLVPAVLKVKFQANELVSSLMLNYIVRYSGCLLYTSFQWSLPG